jgi:16S rRNA (uracil1498-N3)-methyltransferase
VHRFFAPHLNISANRIIIDDKEQIHYIRDVLRLKENELIVIFDGLGNEYDCVIDNLEDKLGLRIKERHLQKKARYKIKIAVACAIPKKSKIDDIIDKLTQLGVDRIIPLKTKRVIIKLDKHKETLRLERWRKIIQAASQQSQRNTMPVIEPIQDLREFLPKTEDFDLKLIPTLFGERKSLKRVFSKCKPRNILVLIGPEGDFAEEEVSLAKDAGCIPVTLGNLVLRVETAAIAVAGYIRLNEDN